jgi:NitT/TauT family transport system permease protein
MTRRQIAPLWTAGVFLTLAHSFPEAWAPWHGLIDLLGWGLRETPAVLAGVPFWLWVVIGAILVAGLRLGFSSRSTPQAGAWIVSGLLVLYAAGLLADRWGPLWLVGVDRLTNFFHNVPTYLQPVPWWLWLSATVLAILVLRYRAEGKIGLRLRWSWIIGVFLALAIAHPWLWEPWHWLFWVLVKVGDVVSWVPLPALFLAVPWWFWVSGAVLVIGLLVVFRRSQMRPGSWVGLGLLFLVLTGASALAGSWAPTWNGLPHSVQSFGDGLPVVLRSVSWWLWLVVSCLAYLAVNVGIRRQIPWKWSFGLGLASFAVLALLYTQLSSGIEQARLAKGAGAEEESSKTVPTWSRLLHDGVFKAFQSRKKTSVDLETLEVVEEDEEPWVWTDTKATLSRLVWGMGLSVLVAVPLGVLMGCYSVIAGFFLPPLAYLAKIPTTMIIAVFLALVETGWPLYVAVLLFGLIPILAQTIFHAAKEDVPEELLFKARTLGASQFECIWAVIFQYILPKVIEAIRLQLGPAIVYLIAVEYLNGEVGFGCRARLLQKSLDMSIIYTYAALLGLFGLVVDSVLIWVQKKLCPWYGS